MGMAVTIRELAQRCGLSVSAISKALNDYPDISEQTREYVRKMAREMGYFPNAQARALKTNRSHNIGVVYELMGQDGLMHTFFAQLLDGFKREIERAGYDLTFLHRHIGSAPVSILDHYRYRGMDGALLACVNFRDAEVIRFLESGVPCVTIDHSVPGKCPSVMSDNRAGMSAVVRHVVEKGHRRIGMIYGDRSGVAWERITGFRETMRELRIEVRERYVEEALYHNPDANFKAIERIMARREPPTCILTTDDYSAIGVMNGLREMGLSVGRDISITGYDGIEIGQIIRPRLTTYRQDARFIGEQAARLLVQQIQRSGMPAPEPVFVKGALIEGETVAAI